MVFVTRCILQPARLMVYPQSHPHALLSSSTSRSMYSTKAKYNMNKKVQATVEKMLLKRPKLRKKYYDTSHINQANSTVNSADLGGGKVLKQLKKHVMMRERTVEHIMVREIQDAIDSGVASDDLHLLGITITSASMSSKEACVVTWQADGSQKDVEINELLNSYSGRIRHVIMHSHVIGQVPLLYFQMDQSAALHREMDDLFLQLDIPKTTGTNKILQDDDESVFVDERLQSSSKTKPTVCTESNPTYEMFGLDRDGLLQKIAAAKDGLISGKDTGMLPVRPDLPERRKKSKELKHKSRKHFDWDDYMER